MASLHGELDRALHELITASEIYADLAKSTRNKDERKQIFLLFDECAQEAERVKERQEVVKAKLGNVCIALENAQIQDQVVSHQQAHSRRKECQETRTLSKKEQLLLLRSSTIEGRIFPIWNDANIAHHLHDDELFQDTFQVLQEYEEHVSGYERLTRVIEMATMADLDKKLYLTLSQRVVNDCSLVTSLIVASQWSFRFREEFITMNLFPKDDDDQASINSIGKYMMKVYLNGTTRQVIVDDYLPLDAQGRATTILASSEEYPEVVWPSVLEKVFLKVVNAGFKGSESASDLRLLTGWIPQELSFLSIDTDMQVLWPSLKQSWVAGDVLVTLGSGKLSKEQEAETGIVSEHNYAVVGLREEADQKTLTVQNPWQGDSVASSFERRFEMDFSQCRYRFKTLFLNWNPRRWLHKCTMHLTTFDTQFSMTDHNIHACPQLCISNSHATSASIFLLLERHRPAKAQANIYSSLSVFDGSERVSTAASPLSRTDLHGSLHVSLEFTIPARTSRVIAITHRNHPSGASFATVTAYTQTPITMTLVPDSTLERIVFQDSWDPSAGPSGSRFSLNPRYRITVTGETQVTIILEHEETVAALFAVVYGHKDILALSRANTRFVVGEYTTRHVSATLTLQKGQYGLLLSTHKAGMSGPYQLTILSDHELNMDKARRVNAGRIRNALTSHWSKGLSVQRFQIVSVRMNTLTVHVHGPRHAQLKVSIQGAESVEHTEEGQGSVGLDRITVQRDKVYILVCEVTRGIVEDEFEVQVYSDGILKLSRC